MRSNNCLGSTINTRKKSFGVYQFFEVRFFLPDKMIEVAQRLPVDILKRYVWVLILAVFSCFSN